MTTDELISAIIKWGKERNINNPSMQLCKVLEEAGEIAHEITRGHYDTDELADAFGDTLVTIIILADICHMDVNHCLQVAYDAIKNRKGKTIDGSFVKESTL